jgi:cell division protein FtsB
MAGESTIRPRTARRTGASRSGGGLLARSASGQVRWDRVGRVALLCVLVALVYLYVSAGFHMLSTWKQSQHDGAAVASMEHEHAQLVRQREQLSGQPALEAQARKLGMMRRGEQPYLISGLPAN